MNDTTRKNSNTPKSLTELNAVGASFEGKAIPNHTGGKDSQKATTVPTARRVIEAMINRPPEAVADDVRDTYPGISLEDAKRIRDGLTAVLTAGTRAEENRLGRDYKALHEELKKKYGKSGKR